MNFFKSIFSDDPDPSDPQKPSSDTDVDYQQHEDEQEVQPSIDDDQDPDPNAWSFGGLMKTIASRSESVIQTYRRDLEEFGSGLKKETAVIREVASRAVKDLPASFEVGASVAQESLETVGQAIDDFGSTVLKEAAEIISHGKEAILAVDQDTDSSSDNNNSSSLSNNNSNQFGDRGLDSKRYSRFDAQLNAIQSDANTYCEEPEDLDDYVNWKRGFVIDEKGEEIESLIEENGEMRGNYWKLVPSTVDHVSFWSRYFYRVHKLKQAEDARAKLVKRAISGEEEEDLTWDFDDEEAGENNGLVLRGDLAGSRGLENKDSHVIAKENKDAEGSGVEMAGSGEKSSQSQNDDKGSVVEYIKSDNGADDEVILEGKSDLSEVRTDKTEEKFDEKMGSEGKVDNCGSCKDSDISIVSSQPSLPEEEDLGWDEIEDIGSNDENKVDVGGNPNRVALCKRLSGAEEEEDLTWDIEDDDEPVKP